MLNEEEKKIKLKKVMVKQHQQGLINLFLFHLFFNFYSTKTMNENKRTLK